MVTGIIHAAILVGVIGILIGLLLGFAGIKLAVPVDEKEIEVREFLPGNNCGGCGYAGCDALAKAIAAGEAPVNACPVGGAAVAEKIGAVMGSRQIITVSLTVREPQRFQDAATRHAPLAVWDLVPVWQRVSSMRSM